MFLKNIAELTMKKLLLIGLFLSFSAFSETKKVHLSPADSLNVTCDKGNVLKQDGDNFKCGCGENEYPVLNGKKLSCEVLCEIKVDKTPSSEEICDQGGCFTYSRESRNVLVLIRYSKVYDRKLYEEIIYSPRESELQMLVDEAKKVAIDQCYQVVYKGKYLFDK